jgi:hypothetical protein
MMARAGTPWAGTWHIHTAGHVAGARPNRAPNAGPAAHRQATSRAGAWPLSFPSDRRRWRRPEDGARQATGQQARGKGDEQTPTPGAAPGLAAPAAPIEKKDVRRAGLFTCQPPRGRGSVSFRRASSGPRGADCRARPQATCPLRVRSRGNPSDPANTHGQSAFPMSWVPGHDGREIQAFQAGYPKPRVSVPDGLRPQTR